MRARRNFLLFCSRQLRAIEKPQIWSAGKLKRLEKSQFVEDVGDIGYGVGSVFG